MNDKLKNLFYLICLAVGLVLIALFGAFHIVSVTEEPEDRNYDGVIVDVRHITSETDSLGMAREYNHFHYYYIERENYKGFLIYKELINRDYQRSLGFIHTHEFLVGDNVSFTKSRDRAYNLVRI